jgi:hypothetical protein
VKFRTLVFLFCSVVLTYLDSSGYQSQDGGWSAYNRGAENTLQLWLPHLIVDTVICLSQVTLQLEWEVVPTTAIAISFEPNMGPLTGFTSVRVLGFNFLATAEYTCIFGGVPVCVVCMFVCVVVFAYDVSGSRYVCLQHTTHMPKSQLVWRD